MKIEPGSEYRASFPFYLRPKPKYTNPDYEELFPWIPGCLKEDVEQESHYGSLVRTYYLFDGRGEIVLRVVSTHKPGPGYQERVFYTRSWVAPDGSTFGSRKLRVCSIGAFRSLAGGYRHWEGAEESIDYRHDWNEAEAQS